MLFTRKDFGGVQNASFSQRFANQIGRYLPIANDNPIDHASTLEIADCYALLGDDLDNANGDRAQLTQTIQQIIDDYQMKTGDYLNQEQVAFAAVWQDASEQARVLSERFNNLDIPSSILNSHNKTSLLRLALVSDFLQVKQFSAPNTQPVTIKPSTCRRTLDLPLDDTNMPEIEAVGRGLRDECKKAHLDQGVDAESLQTCWRLTLRYEGGKHRLVLKCMPIELLRETFENLHTQKFGSSDEERVIIIEQLEIEVSSVETTSPTELKTSIYPKQWMSQWQATDVNQSGLWAKQGNAVAPKQFNWLHCSVLQDILIKLTPKVAESAVTDFFLTNHQKDVDEVLMRN